MGTTTHTPPSHIKRREQDQIRRSIHRFISAEMPDKYEYAIFHKLVLMHMMHGPCGNKRPTNTCMQNGQYKYHYLRPYNKKSIQAKDGYPIYKRRMGGRIKIARGMNMINQ